MLINLGKIIFNIWREWREREIISTFLAHFLKLVDGEEKRREEIVCSENSQISEQRSGYNNSTVAGDRRTRNLKQTEMLPTASRGRSSSSSSRANPMYLQYLRRIVKVLSLPRLCLFSISSRSVPYLNQTATFQFINDSSSRIWLMKTVCDYLTWCYRCLRNFYDFIIFLSVNIGAVLLLVRSEILFLFCILVAILFTWLVLVRSFVVPLFVIYFTLFNYCLIL